MFKSVLVALDGSDLSTRAIGTAAAVARRLGAPLLAVSGVFDEAAGQQRLPVLQEQAARHGVEFDEFRILQWDDPAACITRVARSLDAPLLCMSTHGHSGLGRALLGSVTEDVLRITDHPVLAVGPHTATGSDPTTGRMLLTTDGSPIAEAAADPAREWALTFGMQPQVVSVVEPNESFATESSLPADDLLESSVPHRLAAELGSDVGAEWEVLHDRSPARAVVQHARQLPAAVIVLSTHGRTGLARITAGSVAMQIIHDSSCPVLIHRPTGLLRS